MIQTHLTVEGGEQWLSWAYGRERALRTLGVPYMARRWDMGDGTTVTVRITPDASYIELRGGAWAAYPFDLVLQTSKVNKWNKITFGTPMPPDPGPQPTEPYIEPPNPDGGYAIVHNTESCAPGLNNYFDVYLYDQSAPSTLAYNLRQAAIRDHLYFTAAEARLYANNPSNAQLNCPLGPDFSVAWIHEGEYQGQPVYHGEYSWNGQLVNESRRISKAIEIAGILQGHADAVAAANAAYQIALAAWQAAYNKWLAAQNGQLDDPSVCYPAFDNVRNSSAATRARQIADLKDEVLIGGMNSLCVFNAVARPVYAPVAFPAEPFVVARTADEQLVWAGPGRYADAPFTISTTTLADSSSCTGASPAYAYAGVHVDRRPLDDRPKVTTKRAHGFSVTGTYYAEEHGMPEATDPRGVVFAPSYADWMKSRKAVFDRATYLRLADLSVVGFDPDAKAWMDASTTPPTGIVGRPVDFDLTYGRTDKVRVMHFEFRVYDPFTSQWQWVAAKSLTGVNTVSECITGGCKNATRPSSGGVEPPTDGRFVSHMRFLAAKEYRFASTSDGVGTEWVANTELDVVGTSKFNIDLSAYSFNSDTLPDGVAVMYGLSNQELPAVPSCAQGTTKQHLDSLAIPDSSSTVVNFAALKEWVVKTATNALTKATPKPTN